MASKSLRNEKRKKRYAEDPDYRRRTLAYNRAYVAAHKAEVREQRRRLWRRRYGVSPEEYHAIEARQRGACAICKKKSERSLCIDHCNSTGKVRGLLCRKCNSAIGFCGDSPAVVRAALEYLEAAGGNTQTGRMERRAIRTGSETKKPARRGAGGHSASNRISPSK